MKADFKKKLKAKNLVFDYIKLFTYDQKTIDVLSRSIKSIDYDNLENCPFVKVLLITGVLK